MDSSTTHQGAPTKQIAPEFGTWPTEGKQLDEINVVRQKFDELLGVISNRVPKGNERYLALTKTKLEEACMFAVKAIAKPTTN